MLKVVYITSDENEVKEIENILNDKGYLIKITASENGYQIKAPESEADAVYRSIISNLG
ncbi:MAG: hypothetical protein ACOCRB_00670 [Halanaerobiaceae bacterium]